MRARLRAYTADGSTLLTGAGILSTGVLPTIKGTLSFSVEVGGGGGLQFTAKAAHLDGLGCRDSVIRVELATGSTDAGYSDDYASDYSEAVEWTAVAAYTLRPPFRRDRVGKPLVQCTGVAILEQWASEAVIFPEYATGTMPQSAGTERAVGWQTTAYDPSADANEAWAGCYETSRTTMPTESAETSAAWPSGTGAAWISITGASDAAERKLFRTAQASPLSITAAGPVRVLIASDSPGTLYIAGEPVLVVDGGEPGKLPIRYQQADLFMQPGDYACAYDTDSIWDTGGDGVDPCIIAICSLDADGDPDTWLLVSSDTDWVACRRDAEPPDNDPPGPTPGQTVAMLVAEVAAREVSGWAEVTDDFSATTDSYADAWSTVVIERQVRYGSDTLWTVFRMLSETNECDTWMTPDLVLHAANAQGEDLTATLTLSGADITSMSDVTQPDEGTYAMALALDGWSDSGTTGPRREYAMETGTAITRAVATRVINSALAENGRWDGSCRLGPNAPVPLVDFNPGDRVGLTYQDAPTEVQVLSVSATAGGGGLLWDLELAEVVAP